MSPPPGPDPHDGSDRPPSFRVTASRAGLAWVLHLSGDLDVDTAPVLQDGVRQALESGACRLLVLDLARLDFCDSSGLHELLHARANPRHVPLVLAAPSPRFVRLLELAGAEGVFVLAGGVQSAIDYHRLESAWQRQLDQEKPGEDAQEPGGTP